jgi:hypothetical protein
MLLFLIVVTGVVDHGRVDVTPFTLEEWMWATKGGYLHTMLLHYIANGGL